MARIVTAEGKEYSGIPSQEWLKERIRPWGFKLSSFLLAGYRPHIWQLLAHTSKARWIVMGAGRRGGKTRSAAKEAARLADPRTAYEILKMRGVNIEEGDIIVGSVVTPEYAAYPTTYREFLQALEELGIEYQHNKTDRAVGIPSLEIGKTQSLIYFKGASEPDRLRGDGWHWTWWDEPAFIKGSDAWDIGRAQLAQTMGCGIFSTTPGSDESHWWFFDTFISKDTGIKDVEYVEWFSIDNPYFPKEEWEDLFKRTHPRIFRREYMAMWERGGGRDLKLSWLEKWAYKEDELHLNAARLIDDKRYRIYAGVDVASSLTQSADFFAIVVIAVDPDTGVGYLVDLIRDKCDFPAQLDHLFALQSKWKPIMIGVEQTGYQRVLVQQAGLLPNMPIVTGIEARGKKEERIIAASAAFREGRLRVPHHSTDRGLRFKEFYTEWGDFPDAKHDDCLDAAEICLRTVGIFMPDVKYTQEKREKLPEDPRARTIYLTCGRSDDHEADEWGIYDY